jgi:hypothetical protein
MFSRFTLAALLVCSLSAAELAREREMLVAHEWGTFTSVAAEDGHPVKWAPLAGPGDLPCFVARINPYNSPKGYSGFVRMETPVLYFYAQQAATLSVRVGFPQGWITEWYPNATSVSPAIGTAATQDGYRHGRIAWNNVQITPGANPALPSSKGASHYFAARETDSAPLRVADQWEKLIFYRGIGDFDVPLEPAYQRDGHLKVSNDAGLKVPVAILFENKGGKIGYRVARSLGRVTDMTPPDLNANITDLRRDIETELTEAGLFRKEAHAMVETWHDSWFEEGARLFYVLPQGFVDKVLPLEIAPAPGATSRVFVGRIELLSKNVEETLTSAMNRGDVETLTRFGRFLQTFVGQMQGKSGQRLYSNPTYANAVTKVMREFYGTPSCVK